MNGKYIRIGPIADTVPYDNADNCLEAETTQEAIDEIVDNHRLRLASVRVLPCGAIMEACVLVDQELCYLKSVSC